MSQKNSSSKMYSIVMAGGRGTRFWPESTSKMPKQYLNLFSDNSLLVETLVRFDSLIDKDNRYIVTVKEQEEICQQRSAGHIGSESIILEPSGRNTAPCILLSLAHLLRVGATKEDVVCIVPADHVILNHKGFREVLTQASQVALNDKKIVTIGIVPTFPHTGYGYIQKGESLSTECFAVKQFKEKPDFNTAKTYLSTGEYYWNAGMFVSSIGTLLSEFEKTSPEIFKFFDKLKNNYNNFTKLLEIYNQIPKDSIDYAVMEKSKNVAVVPSKFDWNDLGSWDALESVIDQKDSNTVINTKKYYFDNSKNNIIFAPKQFVSLVNIDDYIIVSNDKVLMVVPKNDAQKVKTIVEYLQDNNLKELL